jgi:hypothetical protein
MRRGQILMNEREVDLYVYVCPEGEGWHLTSFDLVQQAEFLEEAGLTTGLGKKVPLGPLGIGV